jgi:hypothetical protein
MIYLPNLVLESGLDLNVESQTVGFLRAFAPNRHAPRPARICTTHALPASEHVSALSIHGGRRDDQAAVDDEVVKSFRDYTHDLHGEEPDAVVSGGSTISR